MIRRFKRRDLVSAREMVSRAEREALERAEELSRQASEMLAVVQQRRDETVVEPAATPASPPFTQAEPAPAPPSPSPDPSPGGGAAEVDAPRGGAPEARAGIEDELSAEMAKLARVLDRTRRDLEDVLTERLSPAGPRPGPDPRPAATGGRGAGVGGR